MYITKITNLLRAGDVNCIPTCAGFSGGEYGVAPSLIEREGEAGGRAAAFRGAGRSKSSVSCKLAFRLRLDGIQIRSRVDTIALQSGLLVRVAGAREITAYFQSWGFQLLNVMRDHSGANKYRTSSLHGEVLL